jgi:carboxyl-terminal processing protease
MNSGLKVAVAVALAFIVGASGFIGGFAVAKVGTPFGAAPETVQVGDENLSAGEHVDEVNRLLRTDALEPPKETSATAGAIQGLLESNGDKYAMYFDQKHFEYFNEDMAGEFGGIGVLLGEKDGTSYIVEVYKDTPAQRAGIEAGDLFSVIAGVTRKKWTNEEVVKRVRGEAGTEVELTMIRPGKAGEPGKEGVPGKTYTVKVKRAMIQYPNIESEMKPGKVGYIRLGQFNAQATEDIADAVKKLEREGARSFVLDLRDNPGGALDQAVGVSSLFQPSGVVVRVEERGKPETEHRTTAKKITDAPLVVLINGNSASASEIVGGALQDYGRAVLVGEKSFGKGSVQTIKELSFGGAVKFTIAHYLTPKSRVINGKGLTPDVIVKMDQEKQTEEAADAQLKRGLDEARKAQ